MSRDEPGTQHTGGPTISEAIGVDVLRGSLVDLVDLLDAAVGVFEADGALAFGLFARESSWCGHLCERSRARCGTLDDGAAAASGQWTCREEAWAGASRACLRAGRSIEFRCHGGRWIHATPVRVGTEAIGTVVFSHGDPPADHAVVQAIAGAFGACPDELVRRARAHRPRGTVLVEAAKRHVQTIAMLIGEVVRNRREEERREQLRELLLGTVAHDLRSPITAILMTSQRLQRHAAPDPVRRSAATIERSARRIQRMVEQLLDLTRIRLGGGLPHEPAPTDVKQLVEGVVEEVRAAYPGVEIRVHLEPPDGGGLFTCDRERMAHVLTNLLANAITHGQPLSPIDLRQSQDPEGLRVQVHNEGDPIDPDLIPLLFDPFRSGSVPRASGGGLGLGLFICREIVMAHGGAIAVDSDARSGTTFTVCIPPGARMPARPVEH